MKIFTENSVYVQMSDIIYLIKDLSIVLPECVSTEIYGKGNGIMEIDTTKKDKFIRFTDKDSIKWFKEDNIILNYNEVKGLRKEEVQKLINETNLDFFNTLFRATSLLTQMGSINEEDANTEIDKLNLSLDNREVRQKSLYAYLNHITWKKRIKFPKEVKEKTLRAPFLRLPFRKSKKNEKQS